MITLVEMAAQRDREDQEVIAIATLCWWLRWVLDEDERRALREFRAAYVMYRAGWFPSTHPRTVEDRERLERADAMLRAREGK